MCNFMRKMVTSIMLVVCLLGGSLATEMSYKEQMIRDVLKDMLHITPPGSLPDHLIAPPRHMLELYNSYSKSRGVGGAVVKTVRNILASKAPQELEEMSDLLFFNVSCIESKDEVRLGQLLLNRRRLHQSHHHKRMLVPSFRIWLFQVDGARIKTLGSIPRSQVARGTWQTVDITPALREILLDPDVPDKLLGVRFEAPEGKMLSPHHFLYDSDEQPASLVVFSEHSLDNEVTDEGTVPSPEPPVHTHAIVQKLQSSTPHAYTMTPDVDSSLEVGVTEPSPEVVPQERISGNIPGLAERRGPRGRKGRRRRMINKKNANQEPGTSAECKVEMLSIDFERMGYEWIVAPKSFNANYCAGSCRFPLSKNLNATNHAGLQTILHYKGNTLVVPDDSCVPDNFEPLTIIYFDPMHNVMLKRIPNMIVRSCTCRQGTTKLLQGDKFES